MGYRRISGVININLGIRWFEYEDVCSIECEVVVDLGYVEKGVKWLGIGGVFIYNVNFFCEIMKLVLFWRIYNIFCFNIVN